MHKGPLGLLLGGMGAALVAAGMTAVGAFAAAPSGASAVPGTTPSWCSQYGASVVGWTGTKPNLPICGPGPENGGTWALVDLPGPYGADRGYYNATPGFQCVELADRFLAVVDGLAPVHGNGQAIAANYHAAYSNTSLYVNGSPQAVGHPPVAGDVISFSDAPDFDAWSAGHVAVVTASSFNRATGNGTVTVAQENVGPGFWNYTLHLVNWRVEDPTTAPDAEWGFPYAEWLQVTPYRAAFGAPPAGLVAKSAQSALSPVAANVTALGLGQRHDLARRSAGSRRLN